MSGRNRGRGRGGGIHIRVKDENGQYITREEALPPPLFPEIKTLPGRPNLEPSDEKLKERSRELASKWQSSGFYLKTPEQATVSIKRSLKDLQSKDENRDAADFNRLLTHLYQYPKYVPEELYSGVSQRRAVKQSALHKAKAAQESDRILNMFAALEAAKDSKIPFDLPSEKPLEATDNQEEQEEEGEGDLEAEIASEADEDDYENDDYLQGQDYQDDEGYEDEGDNDDESAYFS